MTHNEHVLNRSLDSYLMKGYLEEWPEPEQAATTFEDSKPKIVTLVTDYIEVHGELPDIDDVAESFGIKEDADWEALEEFFKREQYWLDKENESCKTPSLK